jgi:arsenate reductase (glutaredoxin)
MLARYALSGWFMRFNRWRVAMPVTMYHNPRCATSRRTLALLRERGVEPEIVEYLKTPPSATELKRILGQLGIPAAKLLRKKEAIAAGIDAKALSEDALIAAMVAHPIVIERPIVLSGAKAALGRPPEAVLSVI